MKEEATIYLPSGGTVKVTFDVNLFAVNDKDAAFVIDMIRLIQRHAAQKKGRALDGTAH